MSDQYTTYDQAETIEPAKSQRIQEDGTVLTLKNYKPVKRNAAGQLCGEIKRAGFKIRKIFEIQSLKKQDEKARYRVYYA